MPSIPVTGTLPARPSARSASTAASAISSLAAQMPPISSPNWVSQALVFSSASVADQLATCRSSSLTSGFASSACISPALRSIAGTFDSMPPSATMPPLPPIALISASAICLP